MYWASKRITTRTEDIAYCLLGIFNVNLPLLYGEGSKAFLRLQEEIIRTSNDESIFAWTDPEPHQGDEYPVLAPHPGAFASAKYIHRTLSESGSVYSITNRGLQFESKMCSFLSRDRFLDGITIIQLACAEGHLVKNTLQTSQKGDYDRTASARGPATGRSAAAPGLIALKAEKGRPYYRMFAGSLDLEELQQALQSSRDEVTSRGFVKQSIVIDTGINEYAESGVHHQRDVWALSDFNTRANIWHQVGMIKER